MTRRVAIECYADEDLVQVMAERGGLRLRGLHRYGQGQVVDAVLVRGTADVGIVDEDPGKSHHPARDRTEVVEATEDVVWRRRGERHLFVIKPDLEACFLRSSKRIGRRPKDLPNEPAELQRMLNRPRPSAEHAAFRRELAILRDDSDRKGKTTFVAELERMIRAIPD